MMPMSLLHAFDASSEKHQNVPLPTPDLHQECLVLDSRRNWQQTQQTFKITYIVQWTPTDCVVYSIGVNSPIVQTAIGQITIPSLTNASPATVRPSRMTLTIRNISRSDVVGGAIRYVVLPQQVDWETTLVSLEEFATANFLQELEDMLSNHPDSKTLTAASCTTQHKIVSVPASHDGYQRWYPYSNSVGTNVRTTQVGWMRHAAQNAPMNTILLQLPASADAATANIWDFTIHLQNLCRFPANTTMAHFQTRQGGGADPGTFAKVVQAAAEAASSAMKVDPNTPAGLG